MKEIKKRPDELARAIYRWTGKDWEGNDHTFVVTVLLVDGWGNPYGNRHGLYVVDDSRMYGLDARYDSRFNTVESFYENVLDVLKDEYKEGTWELVSKS